MGKGESGECYRLTENEKAPRREPGPLVRSDVLNSVAPWDARQQVTNATITVGCRVNLGDRPAAAARRTACCSVANCWTAKMSKVSFG